MQLTPEWFDEPGEASAPTREINIWLIGPGVDGQVHKRQTQARLRYISEADLIKAKLSARRWLGKQAGGMPVGADLIMQIERPFILAEALGDPEDPVKALFMSRGKMSGGEVAVEHLAYAAAQPALEVWESFMADEFPVVPTEEQQEELEEQAREP